MRKITPYLILSLFLLSIALPGHADTELSLFEEYTMPGMPTGSLVNLVPLPDGDLLFLGHYDESSIENADSTVIRYSSQDGLRWRYDIPYTSEETSDTLLPLANGLVLTKSIHEFYEEDATRLNFIDPASGLHSEIDNIFGHPNALANSMLITHVQEDGDIALKWYDADNSLLRQTHVDALPYPAKRAQAIETAQGILLLLTQNAYDESASALQIIGLNADDTIRFETVHFIPNIIISAMLPHEDGVLMTGTQIILETRETLPFIAYIDAEGDVPYFVSLHDEHNKKPILFTWRGDELLLMCYGEDMLSLTTLNPSRIPLFDALSSEEAFATAIRRHPLRSLDISEPSADITAIHAFMDSENCLMLAGSICTDDTQGCIDYLPILMPFDEIPLAE